MLVILGILLVCGVALAFSRWRRSAARLLGMALGGLLGIYLISEGVAELWRIDFSRPETYQRDWGGPHLAGVLIVHSGPAVLIVIGALMYFVRSVWRRTAMRTASSSTP